MRRPGEPLREIDVAHLPAGGAMLRHLGPDTANALLVKSRRIPRVHQSIAQRACKAFVSLGPEDAAMAAVGQMSSTAGT
eukprot:752218-Hanusia_phi.AAC.12